VHAAVDGLTTRIMGEEGSSGEAIAPYSSVVQDLLRAGCDANAAPPGKDTPLQMVWNVEASLPQTSFPALGEVEGLLVRAGGFACARGG